MRHEVRETNENGSTQTGGGDDSRSGCPRFHVFFNVYTFSPSLKN